LDDQHANPFKAKGKEEDKKGKKQEGVMTSTTFIFRNGQKILLLSKSQALAARPSDGGRLKNWLKA